jgi:hypothetical protein
MKSKCLGWAEHVAGNERLSNIIYVVMSLRNRHSEDEEVNCGVTSKRT